MTTFDFSDVEAFLDCHPDLFEEYLVRKAKCDQVGRWLKEHPPSKVSVAEERRGAPMDQTWSANPEALRRRSSHMELRRNFARSKATTAHRTYDEHVSLSEYESQSSMRRRALLRKASSLPPTTAHILSALLESRVNVPQYASSAIDYKYRLKETNEREFFLELVKDISNDLDLTNLSYKILINVCILVDADRCSLFLVEGPAHKRTLVSKFFDVHSGTTVRPSSSTLNSNEVQVPWGKGIIGYVAEHGETVNIPNAYEVNPLVKVREGSLSSLYLCCKQQAYSLRLNYMSHDRVCDYHACRHYNRLPAHCPFRPAPPVAPHIVISRPRAALVSAPISTTGPRSSRTAILQCCRNVPPDFLYS